MSYCRECDLARHLCPGCGASVDHGRVACRECNPTEYAQKKTPADLILVALEAARMVNQAQALASIIPGPAANLKYALDALDHALEAEAREAGQEEAGHWEPATWASVANGEDRVRIRVGGRHEAEVEVALPLTSVSSGATVVQVKLAGRDAPYTMPPSGPVEVWRPSLPDWAAQAYLTLAGAMEGVACRG